MTTDRPAYKFSRRNLLRFGVAGLAVPSLGSLLAACGSDSTAGSAGSGSASKNLVVAAARGGVNMDPDTSAGAPATEVWLNMFDTLVDDGVPADGSASTGPRPGLAASWTADAAKKVWTFKLQPACKSAAGNELSADDIIWSVGRNIAMAGSPGFFLGLAGITSADQVKKIDDKTVQYTIPMPAQSFWLQLFGAPWMAIYDSVEAKKHATAADPWAKTWFAANVAGFGPFSLTSRSADGANVTMSANRGHWAPPKIDTITWTVAQTANSLQLLTRGQSSVGEGYSPSQLDQVAKTSATQVVQIATAGSTFLGMQNTIAPFTDKALRQGIAMALPFKQIVSSAYGAYAEQWKSHIIPSFAGYSDANWKYGETALAAPQLAAYKGVKVTLSYVTGNPTQQAIAVLVQSSLKDAGLDAQLSALDQTTFDTQRLAGKLPFYIDDADVPAVTSGAYQLSHLYATKPIQELFDYKNPAIDALIVKLNSATGSAYDALLNQAQAILADDVPTIPIAWTKFQVPTLKTVSGFNGHVMNLTWAKELAL